MKTYFFRLLDSDDKAADLLRAIRDVDGARGSLVFETDPTSFEAIPRSPFAYWVSDRLRKLFVELQTFDSPERTATIGASTKNDSRYARLWYEVLPTSVARTRIETKDRPWVSYAKGGLFAPFYADIHLVVNWANDGRELKADITEYRGSRGWGYQWSAALNGHGYYFQCGLTWPHRSASFSAAALPAGCIFSNSGKAAFAKPEDLAWLLGLFNSAAMSLLLRVQSDAVRIKYEVGLLQRTPYPMASSEEQARVGEIARQGWLIRRELDTAIETSHAFVLPALLQITTGNLAFRAVAWTEHVASAVGKLAAIQASLDSLCFDLFDLAHSDRSVSVNSWAGSVGSGHEGEPGADADSDGDADAEEVEEFGDVQSDDSLRKLAMELVSWAVGVAFGRFDVRFATLTRPMPDAPDPFDPMPVCSPGMLHDDGGVPVARQSSDYPLAFAEAGILVDDQGHLQDLTAAVRRVFEAVFAADADRWWSDVATLLSPKGQDLRDWLGDRFLEYHVKRYSKSRRKAPIYWQLGTASGQYSVWLYAHRITRDSLFQVQNEVIGPKLAHEERALLNLVQGAGSSPSASQRRQIEAQQAFVENLRQMLEEVRLVAPLWNPSLDDGVVLTMAPLWRLVPNCRPLQKGLKGRWEELAAAKHEWAHISMHLWPERVVPLCRSDRSLAIAHGLENDFWIEGHDGKWTARTVPLRSVDFLILERSSPAVKAALNGMLSVSAAKSSTRASRQKASR